MSLLSVKNLRVTFDTEAGKVEAVRGVSFNLGRERLGIVGESGSGKSTAARCVMNIYQPYVGQIYYKGIDTCDRGQERENLVTLEDVLSLNRQYREVVIGMIDQFRFFALHQVEQHATANITDFLTLHFFVKIEIGIEFT